MEEYIKKQNKKRAKKYFYAVIISILIVIIIALIYVIYTNIEITPQYDTSKQTLEIERLSQTIEKIQNNDKTIEEVIEKVNKSIVGISKLKNTGSTIFLDNSTSKIGIGTGMIVSENGYILTNEHVSGAKYSKCYVTLQSGKNYQASVVWSDSDIDLAIIKINAQNLEYVSLGNSDLSKVGQTVYAIGNPIGFEFQRTVTAGIISALDRTIVLEEDNKKSYMGNLIQTDATINPGNSGGPLINSDGDVIGINSVKITSAEGIGFAIPINVAKPIIQSFITNGSFNEAYLGIFAYDKNIIPYLDSNLEIENGIYVVQVNSNSPAARYGLKEKDILLEVDGIKLEKMCDLRTYIYSKKPGDNVTFQILRNKKELSMQVMLTKK